MKKNLVFILLALPVLLIAEPLSFDLDPALVQQKIDQRIMALEAVQPEVAQVEDRVIPFENRTLQIRIYRPNGQNPLPAALFIHGGGWVGGSIETHDNMARFLCHEGQNIIISVGYTLSPQAKFPVALEECYAALVWVSKNAELLGIDTKRLSVVGDSAGGNMAAALCLLARDRQGPCLSLQILINPATTFAREVAPTRRGDMMRWIATQYLNSVQDASNPYASPLLANDLKGLPPAVILLAEQDELRADGQQYADRLSEAGIPTTVYTQYGIGHLAGEGARATERARETLQVAAEALRVGSSHCRDRLPSTP